MPFRLCDLVMFKKEQDANCKDLQRRERDENQDRPYPSIHDLGPKEYSSISASQTDLETVQTITFKEILRALCWKQRIS